MAAAEKEKLDQNGDRCSKWEAQIAPSVSSAKKQLGALRGYAWTSEYAVSIGLDSGAAKNKELRRS